MYSLCSAVLRLCICLDYSFLILARMCILSYAGVVCHYFFLSFDGLRARAFLMYTRYTALAVWVTTVDSHDPTGHDIVLVSCTR